MQPFDEPVAEPLWVAALLDQTDVPGESDHAPTISGTGVPTVRAEFVRRVGRAGLGEDEAPVRRTGLAALDRQLRGQ
jgi:hypothetical protein